MEVPTVTRRTSIYPGTRSYSGFGIISLVLALIAVVGVIILFFMLVVHKNSIQTYGVAYRIQQESGSASTDTMKTGGNNMYVINSSALTTLTLLDEGNHLEGRTLAVKNNSTTNTTIQGELGGITLDQGQLNLTVEPGQTAIFMAINRTGTYLRLQ